VRIGNNVILPACVAFKNRVSVGDNVVLPLGYMVVSDIDADTVIKEKFYMRDRFTKYII
jgi:UDP-3-O-[3-hydroxymyristoyl] glucosamine N-acyltransferase